MKSMKNSDNKKYSEMKNSLEDTRPKSCVMEHMQYMVNRLPLRRK